VSLVSSIGPAGEILRLQGERVAALLPEIHAALRAELESSRRPDGTIVAGSSSWIVSAVNPG